MGIVASVQCLRLEATVRSKHVEAAVWNRRLVWHGDVGLRWARRRRRLTCTEDAMPAVALMIAVTAVAGGRPHVDGSRLGIVDPVIAGSTSAGVGSAATIALLRVLVTRR